MIADRGEAIRFRINGRTKAMDILTGISLLGGIALATAAGAAWWALASGRRRPAMVALPAGIVGVLANVVYVGWALADHGPVETFRQNEEAALLLASLISIVAIGTHFTSTLRGLDGFLFLVAALVDFVGLGTSTPSAGEPRYRPWYVSHGLSFAISSACLFMSGMSAVAYLVVHRILRRKKLSLVGRVPSLEALDRFARWTLAIGFPIFTYGILTGLCGIAHREDIARTSWYWDPSAISSLLAWFFYAWLCVSLVFRTRLRGRKAAFFTACGMVLVAISYFVVEFGSPIHR